MLRRTSAQRASRSPGRLSLTQLRDGLAIVALVLGGVWAGIEFFWDRLIAPRLESSLVQISTSQTLVGRTECCVLVELEARLHNTGRRDVYIHASHIAAGAKKLEAVTRLDAPRISDLNEAFVGKHLQLAALPDGALDTLYGVTGPVNGDFVLLMAGNLVSPGSKITPGETIVRRLALVVPAEFPFVALRAMALVVHGAQASQGITWNWTLSPQTMALQVVPWRSDDLARFNELRECGLATADQRAQACRSEALAGGKLLWDAYFKSDRHAYIQPHAMDFLAWKTRSRLRANRP